MKACSFPDCEEEESLPFKCSLCKQTYCAKHRLPEQHNCLMIGIFQTDEYRKAKVTTTKKEKKEEEPKKPKRYRESVYGPRDSERKSVYMESKDRFLTRSSMFSIFSVGKDVFNILLLATYFFLIICLHQLIQTSSNWKDNIPPWSIIFGYTVGAFALGIGVLYAGHMIVENIVARKLGTRTAHVIWLQGLLLGLFSIIFPFFLLPGYLVFRDLDSSAEQRGKVALSGVLWIFFWQIGSFIVVILNISNVIILGPIIAYAAGIFATFFNIYLVFTLIPIGLSHGSYISRWKRNLNWILIAIAFVYLITTLVITRI